MTAGNPLPALAGPDDLAEFLGEDISDEARQRRAASLLRRATGEICDYCDQTWTGLDGQLAAVPIVVETICLEVAGRAFTNIEGITSETDGDYTATRAGDDDEAGTIYLTEGQKQRLAKYVKTSTTKARPGLWTQATTRDDTDGPRMAANEYDPFIAGWPAP